MDHITPAGLEILKSPNPFMPKPGQIREVAVLAWQRELANDEMRSRQQLTYSGPAERITREQLRQVLKDANAMGGSIKELDAIGETKLERERENDRARRLREEEARYA